MQGLINKINSIFSWITKLAYLNGLWILFCLIGLVVVGFFPATVAMMTVCRKWLSGESDLPVFRTFEKTFKSVLLSSNLLGWFFSAIGLILYLNFLVLQANIGQVSIVVISAFYLFVFLYVITVTHVFPILVHYHVSFLTCVRNALVMSLVNVHISLAIIISQSAFYYLMFTYPGTAIFFLGSILSVIQMWLALQSFRRFDKKAALQKKSKEVYV